MSLCTFFQYWLRRIYTSFIADAYLNPLLIENNIRFLYDQNFIHRPLNRHDKLNFEFNQIILQATINFIWMSILAIFAFSLETLIYPTPFAHPSPHTIKRAYILISSFCAAFVLFKPFQYQGWNIRIW